MEQLLATDERVTLTKVRRMSDDHRQVRVDNKICGSLKESPLLIKNGSKWVGTLLKDVDGQRQKLFGRKDAAIEYVINNRTA